MALDDLDHDRSGSSSATTSNGGAADDASLMQAFEEAASSALEKTENFVRENPLTALAGVAAASAIVAIALSRKSQPALLDRRLMNELSRHTEDVSRAIRKNASAFSNSDTAQALESFISRLVGTVSDTVSKLPEAVSNKVDEMRK